MNNRHLATVTVALGLIVTTSALAQRPEPGTGPVASACQQDIEKLCSGKEHGAGAVRDCLETNKSKVSAACAVALDSTGGGRGRGQ